MRNCILCAFIALALPCFAFAQQPPAPDKPPAFVPLQKLDAAQSKLAELLEAKIRAAWAAFKKRDKDAYALFLTDDFQAVESDGDGERNKLQTVREVEHRDRKSTRLNSSHG